MESSNIRVFKLCVYAVHKPENTSIKGDGYPALRTYPIWRPFSKISLYDDYLHRFMCGRKM